MAVYKVPQDVEAEDKLLGPFSFRQFIYLIIVAICGAVLFFVFRGAPIFVGLIVLLALLPVILLFAALALPIKKDQPMETYLVALVRFFIKPRLRLWNSDGSVSLVEITAPKMVEAQLTKGLSGAEAESRLSYLATLMDTQGWAAKGVAGAPPIPGPTAVVVADDTEDVMDENASVARSFDKLINETDAKRRQEAVERMRQPQRTAAAAPTSLKPGPTSPAAEGPAPTFNPYPTSIHQRVVNPLGEESDDTPQPATPAQPVITQTDDTQTTASAMPQQVSPDIMRLAENKDLSISAIAHEAHRIQEKQDENEVVISLR